MKSVSPIAPGSPKASGSPMADVSRLPPSLWAATVQETFSGEPLHGQHRFDIATVGGGFAGLTAALEAAQAGARVAVLEASEPGWGLQVAMAGRLFLALSGIRMNLWRSLGLTWASGWYHLRGLCQTRFLN